MKKITTKILITKNTWRYYSKNKKKIYVTGFFHDYTDEELLKNINDYDIFSFNKILKKLDGNFAIIINDNDSLFAAVDRISSYPLIYSIRKNVLYLSDNGIILKKIMKLKNHDLDYKVSTAFAMSGYTIDRNTIYNDVKNLCAGEYLLFKRNKIVVDYFFKWRPWRKYKEENFNSNKLSKINENIILKLISSCKGRQIIVPLSAGWDSRFIVSGLKYFNYKKVICVTYGKKNSTDMNLASKISKSLKYPWIPIVYNKSEIRKTYKSKKYQKYKRYCDNLNSIYFMGEYYMLEAIRKNSLIENDAIIVNGQSGDFISGNHIPHKITNNTSSLYLVLQEYILKHNKYWGVLITKKKKDIIFSLLKDQINHLLEGKKEKKLNMYGLYEALEFYNRQVKYVINGVRNYEFFNFDWRMPLWDFEYLKYWEKAPYKAKLNQSLYKYSISKSNWAGVWQDMEVNPKARIPNGLEFIRYFFKIIFFFLGKEKWYKFERKYLEYFIDDLKSYAPWTYKEVFLDKRQHFSAISWYIAAYLEEKKISWDGKVVNDQFLKTSKKNF